MKNIAQILILILLANFVTAQTSLDKKEMKALEKKFQIYDPGKTFKSAERIALPGVNLRFKLASKESITDGKQQDQVKYSSWAILDGIDDSDFQEITDQFQQMLIEKFSKMGLEIVPPTAYETDKNYLKLVENNTKDRMTVKKTWGAAKVFSADQRPFFVYPMSALGPHVKFAKSVDCLIANIHLTIDFAFIGFKTERYHDYAYTHRSATSTIVPVIRIEGMTENALQVRTDGSYISIIKDQSNAHSLTLNSEFSSDLEYAADLSSCENCMPQFTESEFLDIFRSGNVTGTYRIKADKAKYKAAVLDALDKLSDSWFIIYNAQK